MCVTPPSLPNPSLPPFPPSVGTAGRLYAAIETERVVGCIPLVDMLLFHCVARKDVDGIHVLCVQLSPEMAAVHPRLPHLLALLQRIYIAN